MSYRTTALRVEHTLDRFRNVNKTVLFAVLSAGGAFLGSFIGLNINPFTYPSLSHLLWWDAVLGCGIGLTVAVVQNWHLGRLTVAQRDLLRASAISAMGGLVAGFALFTVKSSLGLFFHTFGFMFIPHVAAWTAEGIVIALAVSRAIPNLALRSALIAGSIAGALGGILTHGSALHVAFADALKGVFIALFLVVAERLAREAWLVIKRARASTATAGRGLTLLAEPPTLSLGKTPILIGSSRECQIVLPTDSGPPVRGEVRFEKGLVTYHDRVDHRTQSLTSGQTLSFGDLTVEVGTRGDEAKSSGGR